MNRYWTARLSFFLFFLSLVLCFIHYFIFGDAYYIIKHLIGNLAFLPIEVLLVTIILHRLLNEREKRIMIKKLNMVIGAFFSEAGDRLLKVFAEFDSDSQELVKNLIIDNNWSDKDFNNAGIYVKKHSYNMKIHYDSLEYLHVYLIEKRGFLLRLLENPNMLEHESFSELLWAVFHLTEELIVRQNLRQLSSADTEHLSNDMKRAYIFLISEWLQYMKHLSEDYPYLFSLAIRTNPYNPNATPEIK